ncbi:MAG: type II toxin-antitoxin system Phd/YefM family antitoxin [Deltaproteobacteria bacterium]|jgi:prevent-host-death family protein|nr:type II toxin-antitoxin system Phd/YefM family antitoxin [Deltaproteobacteria bacterium]
MPTVVNIHAAKTHLSRLVERAHGGEEIVIARGGEPKARLMPLAAKRAARRPGLLKGKIAVAEDFDAPLPKDLLAAFYRGKLEPRPARRRARR